MLNQITPLILTYNEAPNIGRTLNQLQWASDIVVVDSFSDDETLNILKTFPQVRVYQRKFDSHGQQWSFGLTKTGISSEWVLALDADYVLTDDFSTELRDLNTEPEINGYRARFIYCVHGRRITSGVYPPVTVLYRRERAHYEQDGHTQRVVIEGRVTELKSPLLHDDRKSLRRWLNTQADDTKLEAEKLLAVPASSMRWSDRIRSWRVIASPAMLFYCLIIRRGVFEGWAGFYYAFQRALAELTVSLYLIDHDLATSNSEMHKSEVEHNLPKDRGYSDLPLGSQVANHSTKSDRVNS